MVTDGYASQTSVEIAFYIGLAMRQHNIQGRLTGEAGGYWVSGKPYIPSVAFMSLVRQPIPEYDQLYNVLAPDLAVEILQPDDSKHDVSTKITDYLTAGTTVWLFSTQNRTVTAHTSGQPVSFLNTHDYLGGGNILPGFRVLVDDLFPT